MIYPKLKFNKEVTIAFDVDGTLIDTKGKPRYEIIELFNHFKKFKCTMIIWSGGGISYAQSWADKLGLRASVVAKGSIQPRIAFDDQPVKLGIINIIV